MERRARAWAVGAAIGALSLAVACRPGGLTVLDEARAADEPTKGASSRTDSVAVVELFTSEGCSSCPAADDVVAELDRASRAGGGERRVIALAFHVDYWDELGWPDPFASPAYSMRQRAYGRTLGSNGIYTPQMVVEGADAFVGSDRSHAAESIARALDHPVAARVSIAVTPQGTDAVVVAYDVSGDVPVGATLALAVVEREASVRVRAGENAGKTLRHTNIVRAFVEMALARRSGSQTMTLPPELRASPTVAGSAGEVVAFVQRAAAGGAGSAIVGAASAPLR